MAPSKIPGMHRTYCRPTMCKYQSIEGKWQAAPGCRAVRHKLVGLAQIPDTTYNVLQSTAATEIEHELTRCAHIPHITFDKLQNLTAKEARAMR